MYGAILGDIIGSPYEFDRGDKTKDFPLFDKVCRFTDDSVMTLRNAISLGGDTDTIGAMAGSIAEAFYDLPSELIKEAMHHLPQDMIDVAEDFYTTLIGCSPGTRHENNASV